MHFKAFQNISKHFKALIFFCVKNTSGIFRITHRDELGRVGDGLEKECLGRRSLLMIMQGGKDHDKPGEKIMVMIMQGGKDHDIMPGEKIMVIIMKGGKDHDKPGEKMIIMKGGKYHD